MNRNGQPPASRARSQPEQLPYLLQAPVTVPSPTSNVLTEAIRLHQTLQVQQALQAQALQQALQQQQVLSLAAATIPRSLPDPTTQLQNTLLQALLQQQQPPPAPQVLATRPSPPAPRRAASSSSTTTSTSTTQRSTHDILKSLGQK